MSIVRIDSPPRRFITALESIGRHLDTAILRTLAEGPRRFNEIAADLAIVADDELRPALLELDADGFVARRVDPGPPLRVLYELTTLGRELTPALLAVAKWARESERG